MAANPEALAQLARLLGDDRLRTATVDETRGAIDSRFDLLVNGLLNETVASDDVNDRDTALSFIEQRLAFFGDIVSNDQRSRLWQALWEKIEAW